MQAPLLRMTIAEVKTRIGENVTINAFVQSTRDQKSVQFIILRDHTGTIQATAERSAANAGINEVVSGLTRESAVRVQGSVVSNPSVKLQGIEVIITSIQVLSLAEPVMPIDVSGQTTTDPDLRLDWRFLDLRRPENQLIFRIQTTCEWAMRQFWLSNDFIEIHTPKLMGSPSEGGAELFTVDYFGTTASLAQSPQFYKQMAMAAGMDRVFEIGPAFRADPSFTPRHATEFTSVDMEMAWINSHHEIMEFEESWLAYVLQAISDRHGGDIQDVFGAEIVVPRLPFPRIPMAEAQEILRRMHYVPPLETKKGDLDPQGERLLCEHVKREYGHEFVFVTDYPADVRPFYHMRLEEDQTLTKSFDLLWKWMEITTGAQREHRHDVLVAQAMEKGVKLETIRFYLDFFRFGCPPHGGFGFGLARLLTVMLNRKSIREVVFLHRGPNRLTP